MDGTALTHLTDVNVREIAIRERYRLDRLVEPERFWPYLRPCRNRVLLVVDGLTFSEADFGLATFVRTLLDSTAPHVRHEVTLAHVLDAAPADMMAGEGRIARRLTRFRFDDPDHFDPERYDLVMLFGIATAFPSRGTSADGTPYPSDRLADSELRALTAHMDGGGGLFATGDHGALGRALCSAVPRARGMRLWSSTSAQLADDEVSMDGPRRNDTNRVGPSVGSQFDDQSDDVPQVVQPVMYHRRTGLFRSSYPHPLLCGPDGVIRVMPDHPHEGECVEPRSTGARVLVGGQDLGPEYPDAVVAGDRPLPRVISHSSVLSGTTSGSKDPTVADTFGGIAAYDGHRAGVGRVVTDATWHHFVNVNLVGADFYPASNPKRLGFLASAAGQEHLEDIRAYFRNLAVWTTRAERIRCMNSRLLFATVWSDRVLEAVLTTPDVRVATLHPRTLVLIGRHARDVLGRYAGRCQTTSLVLDLVLERAVPRLVPEVDPWGPDPRDERVGDVDWVDLAPVLDAALGGALVALREQLPAPSPELADLEPEKLQEIIADGGATGARLVLDAAREDLEKAAARLQGIVGEKG